MNYYDYYSKRTMIPTRIQRFKKMSKSEYDKMIFRLYTKESTWNLRYLCPYGNKAYWNKLRRNRK